MNIQSILNSANTAGNFPQRTKENENSFSEILSSREKTVNTANTMNARIDARSISFHSRAVEQRPACIVCGQTISSEGTCLCEYPTVINFHGSLNLKRTETPQTECDASEIPAEYADFKAPDNLQDTEKIKLRHRCPICGKVTDDGNCMCKLDDKDPISRGVMRIGGQFKL